MLARLHILSCPVVSWRSPFSHASPSLQLLCTFGFASAFPSSFSFKENSICPHLLILQCPLRQTSYLSLPPLRLLVSLLYNEFLPALKESTGWFSCLCHRHILTLGMDKLVLRIFKFSVGPNSVDCIFASAQEIIIELDKIIIASLALVHLTAVLLAVLIQGLFLSVFPFHSIRIGRKHGVDIR